MSHSKLKKDALVHALNQLLECIHIPIPLYSPTDLTPSLLLAILSSILRVRIGRLPKNDSLDDKDMQLQDVKLLLGMLQTDVLPTLLHNKPDIGLSKIDPSRVVEGKWDELVFLGELLCWIARRMDVLHTDSNPRQAGWSADTSATSQRSPERYHQRPITPTNTTITSTISTMTPSMLSLSRSPNHRASSAASTPHRDMSPTPSSSSTPRLVPETKEMALDWEYSTCSILPFIPHVHPPTQTYSESTQSLTSSTSIYLADGYMTRAHDAVDDSYLPSTPQKKRKKQRSFDNNHLHSLFVSYHKLLEERAQLLDRIATAKVRYPDSAPRKAG